MRENSSKNAEDESGEKKYGEHWGTELDPQDEHMGSKLHEIGNCLA